MALANLGISLKIVSRDTLLALKPKRSIDRLIKCFVNLYFCILRFNLSRLLIAPNLDITSKR
ncbi:MAG: hypothetical protein ACTS6H_01760 [Candidatus Hodgkinia cicadicola]